jgi:methylated-DNA-[protein]-cysteine S-methyltransferase
MIDERDLERRLREEPRNDWSSVLPDLGPAAQSAGLLDVAYAMHDSPMGALLLAATSAGLVRLAYVDDGPERLLEELARRVSPRLLAAPGRLDPARRELEEYFAGRLTRFQIPLDWRLMHGFARRVLQVTADIPYGRVSTYKSVAAQAGSPRGFRAAGNALGSNPMPIVVPCHRVLTTGGGLGGYTGGIERKLALLAVEGQQQL